MRLFATIFIISILSLSSVSVAAQPPKVAVSLKPLHSIVAAVMDGVAAPSLLLEETLRPDAAAIIDNADVIIWLGSDLEAAMAPLLSDAAAMKALTLMANDRLYILESRNDDRKIDPHLWMDPRNMTELARVVGHLLGNKDPANAAVYKRNAEAVMFETERMRKKLEFGLYSLRARPFYAFYDGYQYLERGFGLHGAGTPSEAVCVVGEPSTSQDDLHRIGLESAVKTNRLDVFASTVPAGPGAYLAMMDNTLEALTHCLSR